MKEREPAATLLRAHDTALLTTQLSRCLREAIRADAMTEFRMAPFGDVLLDPHPDLLFVANLLAIHAGGQDPLEPLHAILERDDTLGRV